MQTRIYVVINKEERRLVEATSAAQAIRHCVRNVYAAHVAGTKELASLMSQGVTVERASDSDSIPGGTKSQTNQTQGEENAINHA